jgi:hypothetical protein
VSFSSSFFFLESRSTTQMLTTRTHTHHYEYANTNPTPMRTSEGLSTSRSGDSRRQESTRRQWILCWFVNVIECPGISGYIDLQRSLQVDICIIQYDNPALEWDVSRQKRSQWISHFKEASARYAASSLPFVSFQVFKLATAQPCFNIHHTSTM